jgi:hypothetical protein
MYVLGFTQRDMRNPNALLEVPIITLWRIG